MKPITYTPKIITILALFVGIAYSMIAVGEPAPPKNICLKPNGDCFTAKTQTPPPPPPAPTPDPTTPAPPPAPAPTGNKKSPAKGWMLMVTGQEDKDLFRVDDSKNIAGVTVSHNWKGIEEKRDVYDFSLIDRGIEIMKNRGKKYQIMLITMSYSDAGVDAVPQYLKSPEFDGGIFSDNEIDHASGRAIPAKLTSPKVMARLKKLIQKLGERYDNNPTFSGIVFQETSYPINCKVVKVSDDTYFNALMDRMDAANKAFPRTPKYQRVNFWPCTSGAEMKTLTDKLINALTNKGYGVGFPDVVFRPGGNLETSVFPAIKRLANTKPGVPTECSVQWSNYETATVQRIMDFIRKDIKPHNCSILPRNIPIQWYDNEVLPYIQSHGSIR